MQSFGEQLKKLRLQTVDPETGRPLTQARLAELIDPYAIITDKRIGEWERNKRPLPHAKRDRLLKVIEVLHKYEGIREVGEVENLLDAGKYGWLSAEECQKLNPEWSAERTTTIIMQPNALLPQFDWFQQGVTELSEWSELDDYTAVSHEGRIVHWMNVIGRKLSNASILDFFLWLSLWIIAGILITPLLNWPIASRAELKNGVILYALASLLIPACIAWLTTADFYDSFVLETPRQKWRYRFLKWVSAATGFNCFTSPIVFMALVIFSVARHTGTFWVWIGGMLCVIPLLMGRVGAKRIPADRYRMYGPKLGIHTADWWMFPFASSMGILLSIAIWFGYDFISENPTIIIASFGLVALGFALKHEHHHHPERLPLHRFLIIVGLILPITVVGIVFVLNPPDSSLRQQLIEITLALLLTAYISAGLMLWLITAYSSDGLRPMILAKRFGGYYLLLALSVVAWGRNLLPIWLNALIFIVINAVWLYWLYRQDSRKRRTS